MSKKINKSQDSDIPETPSESTESSEKALETPSESTENNRSRKIGVLEKVKTHPVQALSYLLPLFCFFLVLIVNVTFITKGYRGSFHADCTDTIMWANASYESGHVYDENFNYACLLPFGINIFMQIAISIFGLTMKSHVIGMMCYFVLLVVFFMLMLKEMHWDIRYILSATAVFLAMTLSTYKMREIFWEHTIYYTLGVLFIVIGMYIYCRILNLMQKMRSLEKGSKEYRKTLIHFTVSSAVLLVFVMFTATDGISALSIFAVPFVCGIIAEWFVDSQNKIVSRKSLFTVCTVAGLGLFIFLGLKLNAYWAGDITAGYQEANSGYSGMGDWADHVRSFPFAWIKLLGVKDLGGEKLYGKEGIINLIYLISSLVLLVMPVIATAFYPKYKSKDSQMIRTFVWVHWASSAIVILGYVVGILSAADWRITPVIATSLIIDLLFVHWAVAEKTSAGRISVLLIVPVIAVSLLNVKEVNGINGSDYKKDNNLYGVAEFLEEENLTYGYATFWNANSLTLVSDSKVKCRCINLNENGVWANTYQSSKKWYEGQEGQSEYFLLLDPNEKDTFMNSSDFRVGLISRTVSREVNGTEYTAIVFDSNLF